MLHARLCIQADECCEVEAPFQVNVEIIRSEMALSSDLKSKEVALSYLSILGIIASAIMTYWSSSCLDLLMKQAALA